MKLNEGVLVTVEMKKKNISNPFPKIVLTMWKSAELSTNIVVSPN